MKVRWTRSSLRLRITPEELHALSTHQTIEERMNMPGGFVVQLKTAQETQLASVVGVVTITLSPTDLARLCTPNVEGVYFTHTIRFYVEKDFPCAHPRTFEALEPKSGTFERPEKS